MKKGLFWRVGPFALSLAVSEMNTEGSLFDNCKYDYTPSDAVYDIVLWQMPVAVVFALVGACYIATVVYPFPVPMGVVWNVDRACFLLGCLTSCWMSCVGIFLCLDMLVLPPVLAMLRLSDR